MSDAEPTIPRTVGEAKQRLNDLAPVLNPEMYRRYTAEVSAAEQEATNQATTYVHERFTEVHAIGVDATKAVCAVRDEAQELLRQVQAGLIPARRATTAFNTLRDRHRQIASQLKPVADATAEIEGIEAEPVAWADRLGAIPAMRSRLRKFSF